MARDISERSKYSVANYQADWVTLCLRIREIRGSNRDYLSSPKFHCFIIARQMLGCEIQRCRSRNSSGMLHTVLHDKGLPTLRGDRRAFIFDHEGEDIIILRNTCDCSAIDTA